MQEGWTEIIYMSSAKNGSYWTCSQLLQIVLGSCIEIVQQSTIQSVSRYLQGVCWKPSTLIAPGTRLGWVSAFVLQGLLVCVQRSQNDELLGQHPVMAVEKVTTARVSYKQQNRLTFSPHVDLFGFLLLAQELLVTPTFVLEERIPELT